MISSPQAPPHGSNVAREHTVPAIGALRPEPFFATDPQSLPRLRQRRNGEGRPVNMNGLNGQANKKRWSPPRVLMIFESKQETNPSTPKEGGTPWIILSDWTVTRTAVLLQSSVQRRSTSAKRLSRRTLKHCSILSNRSQADGVCAPRREPTVNGSSRSCTAMYTTWPSWTAGNSKETRTTFGMPWILPTGCVREIWASGSSRCPSR